MLDALRRAWARRRDRLEERLQLALTAGRMGVWERDLRGGSRWWWPEMFALHGLSPDGPIPEDYCALVHADDRVRSCREHALQYRVVSPGGAVHWLEGIGSTLCGPDGKPQPMAGVCVNIDARKEEEAHLQFLAQASAELAAPTDYSATMQRIARLAVPHVGDWCAALSELLKILGHDAQTAADGASALERFAAFHPDVVLLDIGLPDIDGYEVARRMRATQPGPVRLIALTGWGRAEDKRRAAEAGFDAHWTKPVHPGQLKEIWRNACLTPIMSLRCSAGPGTADPLPAPRRRSSRHGRLSNPHAMLTAGDREDIYLSPHSDDICFSLGVLAWHRRRGTLLTVFPGARYQARPHSGQGVAAVSRMRIGEDLQFSRMCGLKSAYMDFIDASTSGWDPFDLRHAPQNTARVEGELLRSLLGPVIGRKSGLRPWLFCPAGVGGHLDHVAVRTVVTRHLARLAAHYRVAFYEDLPYASDPALRARGIEALGTALGSFRMSRCAWSLGHHANTKLALVGAYRSQLTPLMRTLRAFTPSMGDRPVPHEAIWARASDMDPSS